MTGVGINTQWQQLDNLLLAMRRTRYDPGTIGIQRNVGLSYGLGQIDHSVAGSYSQAVSIASNHKRPRACGRFRETRYVTSLLIILLIT